MSWRNAAVVEIEIGTGEDGGGLQELEELARVIQVVEVTKGGALSDVGFEAERT